MARFKKQTRLYGVCVCVCVCVFLIKLSAVTLEHKTIQDSGKRQTAGQIEGSPTDLVFLPRQCSTTWVLKQAAE